MAPSSRIMLAILGVAFLGLALCAALVFGSLDRVSLRTAEANIDFLLTQLRDDIEANVGLGLPLADVRVAQDLIERAKASDAQVLAVEVFSPDGVSLFNTDRGSIGETIAPSWSNAVRFRIENQRWRVEELGYIVVGRPIENDFGEAVGYLAVTISGEARGTHAEAVLAGLAYRAAWVFPAVLAAILLLLIAVFRYSGRATAGLAAELAADAPAGTAATPVADAAAGVRASVDRAVLEFQNAAADVMRLDENEERHAA